MGVVRLCPHKRCLQWLGPWIYFPLSSPSICCLSESHIKLWGLFLRHTWSVHLLRPNSDEVNFFYGSFLRVHVLKRPWWNSTVLCKLQMKHKYLTSQSSLPPPPPHSLGLLHFYCCIIHPSEHRKACQLKFLPILTKVSPVYLCLRCSSPCAYENPPPSHPDCTSPVGPIMGVLPADQ